MPISNEKLQQRKEKIIIAAMQLFLKNDYNLISMDRIAEEAKMTKPTIYKYFRSKSDLFYISCVRAYENRWLETKPNFAKCKNGYQALVEFSNNLINFGFEKPEELVFSSNVNDQVFQSLIFHLNVSDNVVEEYNERFMQTQKAFPTLFYNGVEDGSIKEIKGVSSAMYFLYSLRGYLIERVSTLAKMKKEHADKSEVCKVIDNLLEMSETEVKLHLKNLLILVKA